MVMGRSKAVGIVMCGFNEVHDTCMHALNKLVEMDGVHVAYRWVRNAPLDLGFGR